MSRELYKRAWDNSGQSLLEYALIVALVGMMGVMALYVLGTKTSNTLTNVTTKTQLSAK